MADLFGSQTTTTSRTPIEGLQALFNQTGAGLQGFGDPYQMSQPQWASLGNLVGATNARPPDPVTGNPGWQAYLQNQQNLQGYQSGFSPMQVSAPSVGSASVGGFSQGAPSSYGAVGVGSQAPVTTKQIDPAAAYQAAAHQLAKFATPQVQAAMQASGMGRSGAVGEGIANAAASLELPINQQVLASQAAANQLDAQIAARQGETTMLANLQASLQAQQLTARSQEEYNAIGAQLATVQAQLQQSAMNLQATLSQQASLSNQSAGMQQYQTNVGAGVAQGGQLAGLAAQFPQLFNQQYLSGITGAQAQLAGVNQPQQLDIANLQNQQNFYSKLLGGFGSNTTSTTSQDPGILGYLGAGSQLLGNLGLAQPLGSALLSGGSALGGAISNLFGPTNVTPDSLGNFWDTPAPSLLGTDWLT